MVRTHRVHSKDFHRASDFWSGEKARQRTQQGNFLPTSPYHSGNCQLLWKSLTLRSQWTESNRIVEELEQNNCTGFSIRLKYNSKSQLCLFLITDGQRGGPPKCWLRPTEELGFSSKYILRNPYPKFSLLFVSCLFLFFKELVRGRKSWIEGGGWGPN